MTIKPPPDEADDATLVRRIAERRDDSDTVALDAIRVLIARHAPGVTGYLRAQFAHELQRPEIDQAVNDAGAKVWKSARTFNPGKGEFGPWYLTIAHNCALDLLRGEEEHAEFPEGHDPEDHCDDEDLAPNPEAEWRIQQMDDIIENELRGFEQVVGRALIATGDAVDSRRLAEQYGKTIGTVDTTKSKVKKKIGERILEREAQRNQKKGTK